MYVFHTNQIVSTINSQSEFFFVKVNGMSRKRFVRDTVQNGHVYSSIKEEEIFIYWVNFHIFCGLR